MSHKSTVKGDKKEPINNLDKVKNLNNYNKY